MRKNKFLKRIPLVLVIMGIAFIFIGVFRSEPAVVFQKAAHICLECIGIG